MLCLFPRMLVFLKCSGKVVFSSMKVVFSSMKIPRMLVFLKFFFWEFWVSCLIGAVLDAAFVMICTIH